MKIIQYKIPGLNLCDDFIVQSKKVWNWLKLSLQTNINISEESITDFILLELQSKHPAEIITQKYTRQQESKTGADWEWWLNSSNNWLGLRIQAKKLDSTKLEYPELDKRNRHGKQIDLLINNSFQISPKRIPLYVLYNYWDTNNPDLQWKWNCGTYEPDVNMLGCGLVDAQTIKAVLNRGSIKLKDIAPSMYPWSCLVCCRGFSRNSDDDLPNRAFNFIRGAFNFDIGFDREAFVVRRAPDYVYKILEGEKLMEAEWKEIGINRITIIREKKRY